MPKENAVTVRLGVENSTGSGYSETTTQPYQFKLPGTHVPADPALHPDNFYDYFMADVTPPDHDPYNGARPSFPRTRRFFLNLTLKRLNGENVQEVREDALVAHHLADRISQAQSSTEQDGSGRVIGAQSLVTGDRIPIGGKRFEKVRDDVVKTHQRWVDANVKTFSARGAQRTQNAHNERAARQRFIETPHRYARKYRNLSFKRLNTQAKINRINERI